MPCVSKYSGSSVLVARSVCLPPFSWPGAWPPIIWQQRSSYATSGFTSWTYRAASLKKCLRNRLPARPQSILVRCNMLSSIPAGIERGENWPFPRSPHPDSTTEGQYPARAIDVLSCCNDHHTNIHTVRSRNSPKWEQQ